MSKFKENPNNENSNNMFVKLDCEETQRRMSENVTTEQMYN